MGQSVCEIRIQIETEMGTAFRTENEGLCVLVGIVYYGNICNLLRSTWIDPYNGSRKGFFATDEPALIQEAKSNCPEYEFVRMQLS